MEGNGNNPTMGSRGTQQELELTILMPCLNEALTLPSCISKALGFLARHGVSGEVLVADNGSEDGSQELAQQLGARVVPVSARGYGSALMGGILAARGRFVIMGDADDSYDFSNLMPFLRELRNGTQLVMGNRFRGGIQPGAMPPLHRFLGNPVLTALGRLFFHSNVGDFHCGLRGFCRSAVLSLELQTTGMEFASEMVVKASIKGLLVGEVPTTLSPDGRNRPPHLRTWRDGWRHLRFMLLYSPRWLFLYPGLILMAVGLVTGGWLLPGPRRMGAVTFDVHTLLYAALAVMLGFQAVAFAVLSKVFASDERLVPKDPVLERLRQRIPLELALLAGSLLVLGGFAGSVGAVLAWREHSFGPLDPGRTFRMIIPSVLSMVLGGQIILSGFFLSVLGLRRKGIEQEAGSA